MPLSSADDEVNRIMSLLDLGIKAVRSGEGDVALMAVKAAHDSALRLPQRCEDCPPANYPTDDTRCSECPRRRFVICLPDRSKEKPE